MGILIVLMGFLYAGEGEFFNDSQEIQFCFNSTARGCIERREVAPYGTCIGDAIGNEAVVFKAPDRTYNRCSIDMGCRPVGAQSYIIFQLAIMKKGREHYGAMIMRDFQEIMGNRSFCEEQDRLPAVVSTGDNSSP